MLTDIEETSAHYTKWCNQYVSASKTEQRQFKSIIQSTRAKIERDIRTLMGMELETEDYDRLSKVAREILLNDRIIGD